MVEPAVLGNGGPGGIHDLLKGAVHHGYGYGGSYSLGTPDTFPLKELISPGTYTWLTLLLLAAAWKQKNRQRLVELLPLVLLTAGLLLTHLNGAARYASPLYYCVPVVIGLVGGAS